MRHDSATRRSDAKAIVLMIAVLAGAVGMIGLVLDHVSIDPSKVHPIAAARASSHPAAQRQPVEIVAQAEERWAADESARGTSPDASH
jgi:hypothetical protein